MPIIERSIDDILALMSKTYAQPDLDMIRKAYAFAKQAHDGVTRSTGHDYITHPTATAYKLAEMGLHQNVIAAGLLHDVAEDTPVTIDVIKKEFNEDVASLVESVTKLQKVQYRGEERYAENLRKMFLAMAEDVRVVFIKFADRLHNLQTLYAMPKYKQERTAREAMEIYAPIAGRLGMGEMKGELEDLSFKYLYPKSYDWVRHLMETKIRERGAVISKLIETAEEKIKEAQITSVQIHGRVKRLYSLYRKLQRYDNDIAKIYDLIAIRIVVDSVEDCYAVLGILHQNWSPVPNRIKDYIAQPKPNGYQSLHTTVFTDDGGAAEFQIRTREMHDLAEYGIAAHWKYKSTGRLPSKELKWMEELVKIQKEIEGKKDFLGQLEVLKIDVFKDRIFVFTPQGDVIDLPEGATPVDFAYAIHSDIGNHCAAARVNDSMTNLDTPLISGDVVEVITDRNRKSPNPDWLKFVKTHKARSKILEQTKRGVSKWFSTIIRHDKRASKSMSSSREKK